MLLTCPNCRSGLEVPDGTTAMVRCPACKTVFSAADSPAPAPPQPPPRSPASRHVAGKARLDDDDDRPRRKPAPPPRRQEPEDDDEEPNSPDFDLATLDRKPQKKRRRPEDDGDDSLSPREKQALRAAFNRAAWGCKLVWASLGLFMLSMMLVITFWSLEGGLKTTEPMLVIAAGAIGLLSWLLAAGGVGLCLSGPPSPGHWGYGIAAAVATAFHLLLLFILVGKGNEYSPGMVAEPGGAAQAWGLIPTRLDAVAFYLTIFVYGDQEPVPKADLGFSIVVGIAELIRTTLILLFVSSLARAAGDEELSHKRARAAGFASLGPGFLAAAMLVFAAAMIETRAGQSDFTKIIFTTLLMGIYAIVNFTILPGFLAVREVADACDEPFQSSVPKL